MYLYIINEPSLGQSRTSSDKDYDRDSRHKKDDHKKHKKDDRERKREDKKREDHRKKDKQEDRRRDEKKRVMGLGYLGR